MKEDIREAVKQIYARAITQKSSCCGSDGTGCCGGDPLSQATSIITGNLYQQ